MINISNLNKHFHLGDEVIKAIDNVTFKVKKGEYVAINEYTRIT